MREPNALHGTTDGRWYVSSLPAGQVCTAVPAKIPTEPNALCGTTDGRWYISSLPAGQVCTAVPAKIPTDIHMYHMEKKKQRQQQKSVRSKNYVKLMFASFGVVMLILLPGM